MTVCASLDEVATVAGYPLECVRNVGPRRGQVDAEMQVFDAGIGRSPTMLGCGRDVGHVRDDGALAEAFIEATSGGDARVKRSGSISSRA